ncbi:MAG: hypothetical protein ACK6BZ_08800 [Candidatus Kapaibacterium sp.]
MNEVLIENQELTEKAHPIMGFLEIIMQPYELGRKIIPRWFQIVAIAVLLETFCMTTGMYLVSKSDGVKSEMATLSNHIVKKLEKTRIFNEKEIEEIKKQFESEFELLPIINYYLILNVLKIFVFGALYFFAARFFVEQPSPYSNIMALTAFGAIISGLGMLVSTTIQFLTDTTMYGLTFSFVVDPEKHPLWFSYLSIISVFFLLYYIAVGVAVAGASRMHKQWGYILATIVTTIILCVLGLFYSFIGILLR